MRTKHFIFACLLLLCSCSKNKKKSELKTNPSDSLGYYLSKSEKRDLSKKEKVKLLNQATILIKNSENTLKTRELNYDLISKYFETESWDNYKIATKILLKNSLAANDVISLAKSYRSFGNYYLQKEVFDSSFYYYTKSEKIYYEIKDYDGYSSIMLKKGLIQFNVNDNIGADLSLSKALASEKKINDSRKKYSILLQLGLNTNQLKEYRKSINYFNQSLKVAKDNNLLDNYQETICLSNIGLVYQNLND